MLCILQEDKSESVGQFLCIAKEASCSFKVANRANLKETPNLSCDRAAFGTKTQQLPQSPQLLPLMQCRYD